jgi:uncharacterized membrane protein YtjA (UPF0391 family)
MAGRMKEFFLILALIPLILTALSPVHGEAAGLSKVVFYVN